MALNNIPNITRPGTYFEIDFSAGGSLSTQLPNDILYIGSRLSTGTVAAGVPVQIVGRRDHEIYFGVGSQLAGAIERGRGSCPAGQTIRQWAVALDDAGGGAAAEGDITFTGTATSNGTARIWIAGRRVEVGIPSGTAAAAIPALLAAEDHSKAPAALTDGGTGELTVTARNVGVFGNDIDIRHDELALPAGITAAVTPMANGATNPSISPNTIAAIAALNPKRIVLCYADSTNVDALVDELVARAGYDREQFARGFIGLRGTASAAITYAGDYNSQYLTIALFSASPAPPWEIAAAFAVVDASLADPSANRNNLPIRGLPVPNIEDHLSFSEENNALAAGVALVDFNDTGDVKILRHVTTYTEDDDGNPDDTWQDSSKVNTMWACAFTGDRYFTQKWGDAKLADDGVKPRPGKKIMTPRRLVTETMTVFDRIWVDEGWVEEGSRSTFLSTLLTQRSTLSSTRIDGRALPNLIEPLNVIAFAIAPSSE